MRPSAPASPTEEVAMSSRVCVHRDSEETHNRVGGITYALLKPQSVTARARKNFDLESWCAIREFMRKMRWNRMLALRHF